MERVEEATKQKKKCKIFGYSIWRILAYFIIYSVLGYIIETIFGIITKGTWESRQSFLYGPFCGIYGLGAVIMILSLQHFNQNNNRLFWGGFIVGSIIEYAVSWIGEVILNVKWWDYSNMPLNLNGRICVFFSIFWGLLGIYLMTYINPKVDRLINWIKTKISTKKLKIITIIVTIFLLIDFIITMYALEFFMIRKVHENNLPVTNKEQTDAVYEKIYSNEKLAKFINTFWDDRKMIRTFPNLKIRDKDGNIIYFADYVGDIQPYYYKFNFHLKQNKDEIFNNVE